MVSVRAPRWKMVSTCLWLLSSQSAKSLRLTNFTFLFSKLPFLFSREKSSDSTRSVYPRSISVAAKLLPMNPAAPVTTIIAFEFWAKVTNNLWIC